MWLFVVSLVKFSSIPQAIEIKGRNAKLSSLQPNYLPFLLKSIQVIVLKFVFGTLRICSKYIRFFINRTINQLLRLVK